MLKNKDFALQDAEDIDYKDIDVGKKNVDNLEKTIKSMNHRAEESLPNHFHGPHREAVQNSRDCF